MAQRTGFRFGKQLTLAALLMAGCGVLPTFALAQEGSGGQADTQGKGAAPENKAGAPEARIDLGKFADKKVTLTVEDVTLSEAVRLVMTSIGAEYTIDSALSKAHVSARLSNVRLKVALDILTKVSDLPLTYKLEDGIFKFEPRIDPPAPAEPALPEPVKRPKDEPRIESLRTETDAAHLARLLGGGTGRTLGQPNNNVFGAVGTGNVSGSRNASGFGFNNGTFSFSGGASNRNAGTNGNSASGNMWNFFLNSLLRGGNNNGRRR